MLSCRPSVQLGGLPADAMRVDGGGAARLSPPKPPHCGQLMSVSSPGPLLLFLLQRHDRHLPGMMRDGEEGLF